jgi:amino acid transporter
MASYAITIGCVLMIRLQGRLLPSARYSLGKWGTLVNIIALIYIATVWVFSFFPPMPNPTASTMNWACVMVGGVVLLATVYYIAFGRKTYVPPEETIEEYIERYEREVRGGVVEESVEVEKRDM